MSSSDSDLPAPPDQTKNNVVVKKHKGGLLSNAVRGLVSKKKLRFTHDGFDLDLSYITPRIIALGFPSIGKEAVYRNRREDVVAFFAKYHKFHFKVYNLCRKRPYDAGIFVNEAVGGNYGYFPFDDHNPCSFELLLRICEDIDVQLKANSKNVVAIHCKAGKGRTGTVIAAYLVYAGFVETAVEAMNVFGIKRTKNNKGVTIPSQQRYVRYMEEYIRSKKQMPLVVPIRLSNFIIHTAPNFDVGGGADPYYVIYQNDVEVYHMKKAKFPPIQAMKKDFVKLELPVKHLTLQGDIKVVFKDHDFLSADDAMCHFWFNTAFLHKETHKLSKVNIDVACKDKSNEFFSPMFAISMQVHDIIDQKTPDINAAHYVPRKLDQKNLRSMQASAEIKEPEHLQALATATAIANEEDGEEEEEVSIFKKQRRQMSCQLPSDAVRHLSDDEDSIPPPPPISHTFSMTVPAPEDVQMTEAVPLETIQCVGCNAENTDGDRFCCECGTSLVVNTVSEQPEEPAEAVSAPALPAVTAEDSDGDDESSDDDLPPPPLAAPTSVSVPAWDVVTRAAAISVSVKNAPIPVVPSVKAWEQPPNTREKAVSVVVANVVVEDSSDSDSDDADLPPPPSEMKHASHIIKAPVLKTDNKISAVSPGVVAPALPAAPVGPPPAEDDSSSDEETPAPAVTAPQPPLKKQQQKKASPVISLMTVPEAELEPEPEPEGPLCHYCNTVISDELLQVGEFAFHPKCFRCFSCAKPIEGPMLNVKRHHFHPECLRCGFCDCGLANKAFRFDEDEKMCFCAKHAKKSQRKLDRCHDCKQAIHANTPSLTANGRRYHAACLVCATCSVSLVGKQMGVHDSKIYCAGCVQAMANAPQVVQCCGCKQNVTGECYDVGTDPQLSFHPQCFKCSVCQVECATQPFTCGKTGIFCSTHAGQATLSN